VFSGTRRYLRNVSVEDDHQPTLEFNQDGRLRATELIIVNLKPGHGGAASSRLWEQVSFIDSTASPSAGKFYWQHSITVSSKVLYISFHYLTDWITLLLMFLPWFRRSFSRLSRWECGCNSAPVHVGFVKKKFAFMTGFSPRSLLLSCQYHSTIAPYLFIYHKLYIILANKCVVKLRT
jgi:hypothetical protein